MGVSRHDLPLMVAAFFQKHVGKDGPSETLAIITICSTFFKSVSSTDQTYRKLHNVLSCISGYWQCWEQLPDSTIREASGFILSAVSFLSVSTIIVDPYSPEATSETK